MRRTTWFCAMVSVGLLGGLCGMAAQTSAGQAPDSPMGEWVMRIGQRTIFVLSVHAAEKTGQACAGSFSHPQHFQRGDGASFNHVSGPTEAEPIVACERKAEELSITVQSPTDATDKDTYRLTVRDRAHAELQLEDAPVPPFKLERAKGVVAVSTDWDVDKSYSAEDEMPSNAEMKRIFDEDQKVRQSGPNIDWSVVGKTDAERREQTRKLLSEGALHTGQDFWEAAFVFQHGSTADDYLLAHTLAIVALKKGNQDGAWIAAATLDRYLQSIKQPQIYGTQFRTSQGEATTQEPYDRTLVSDPLRKQLGVPTVEEQQGQRKQYDAERGIH